MDQAELGPTEPAGACSGPLASLMEDESFSAVRRCEASSLEMPGTETPAERSDSLWTISYREPPWGEWDQSESLY